MKKQSEIFFYPMTLHILYLPSLSLNYPSSMKWILFIDHGCHLFFKYGVFLSGFAKVKNLLLQWPQSDILSSEKLIAPSLPVLRIVSFIIITVLNLIIGFLIFRLFPSNIKKTSWKKQHPTYIFPTLSLTHIPNILSLTPITMPGMSCIQ